MTEQAADEGVAEEVFRRAVAGGANAGRVGEFLASAPTSWWDAPSNDLVADVMLVSPVLEPGRVRMRIGAPADDDMWDLSIVAPDRRGLLATTADVCAQHGMTIRSARIASWPGDASWPGVALQRMRIVPESIPLSGEPDWTPLGQALRAALTGDTGPDLAPCVDDGGYSFDRVEGLDDGALRVFVSGVDRVGLLASIAHALTSAGADIRAADLRDEHGMARDVFVVTGIAAGALRS